MSRRTPVNRRPSGASSGMGGDLQENLMYMLERLDEPLYMGPKGRKQNILFEVDPELMNDSQKMTFDKVKEEVALFHQAKGRPIKTFRVTKPEELPDLSYIREVCPRKGFFSFFVQTHQEAFREVYNILMRTKTTSEFMSMAAYLRDNSMINPHLFLYAYTKAVLARPDTRGFKFPALFEIMPDAFVNTVVIKQAEEASRLPPKARQVITANGPSMMAQAMDSPDPTMNPDLQSAAASMARTNAAIKIDRGYTGRDFNPENKLAYFREDMGVNSHHHHWHLIYDHSSSQDRRGELFYYMHHNLIARYDAERLSNGLSRVKKLDLPTTRFLEEGYFSKLTVANSKMSYAGRQANTLICDVQIRPDSDAGVSRETRVDLDDIRKHKDRILEAIDTGYLVQRKVENGKAILTKIELVPRIGALEDPGIDLLGNIAEANHLSVNRGFYGDPGLHIEGHILLANLHDPQGHHKESFGPVGDLPTAMRDPAFYRWHKFIDEIFYAYKQTLAPYSEAQLLWKDIVVNDIRVESKGEGGRTPNTLLTYWMQSDIDLGRGLDIRRGLIRGDEGIWARVTHLNNEEFVYRIKVENKTNGPVEGTFRIFMAPRDNEHGQRLYFLQQRSLFFEMDKFVHIIQPGTQEVVRQSTESSVTIPWEQSFKSLEEQLKNKEMDDLPDCGCGWPQHLLLPKGLPHGMYFDLFVIVTNAKEDLPPDYERSRNRKCKESLSFCGIRNQKYPDTKPMGFPFDRNPLSNRGNSMSRIPNHLKDYLIPNSNMNATEVKIVHQSRVLKLRGGGAPDSMPVRPAERATSRRTKNRPSSPRGGRDFRDADFDDYDY